MIVRRTKTYKNYTVYHRWFAWYPVRLQTFWDPHPPKGTDRCTDTWVWWMPLERRWTGYRWEYRVATP
jgi:hypothetical protein